MAVLTQDQMSLTITASPDGCVDYVRIRGDVDMSDSLGLAAQRLIAANAGLVYVDLGGITFMGSTLASFLVRVANSGRARRNLVLCRPTPMALRVIQLTGLDKLANVRSDLPLWPADDGGAHGDAGGAHEDMRDGASKTSAEGAPVDWRDRAACRSEDPELFFPIGTTDIAVAQLQKAKAVCRTCPVKQPCLDWALHSEPIGQIAGVCAGLSEDERRALRREAARASQPSLAGPEPFDMPD
jgi:WhiB family transcriptional regulator, redox-sensing transcriptional regulator